MIVLDGFMVHLWKTTSFALFRMTILIQTIHMWVHSDDFAECSDCSVEFICLFWGCCLDYLFVSLRVYSASWTFYGWQERPCKLTYHGQVWQLAKLSKVRIAMRCSGFSWVPEIGITRPPTGNLRWAFRSLWRRTWRLLWQRAIRRLWRWLGQNWDGLDMKHREMFHPFPYF